MNYHKVLLISLVICASLTDCSLFAAPGCMDNSMHLTQKYDTKAYHFVACNCPCEKRIPKHDRCVICKHAHTPTTVEIVSGSIKPITPEQEQRYKRYNSYLQDPSHILQAMIYRRMKNR